MSERMKLSQKNLDAIVSSPALRARSTAAFFAKTYAGSELDLLLEPRIYEASVFQLLGIVNELPADHDTIAMIGHNPGFSELTTYLCGVHIQMPTCAVVALVFEVNEWNMISANSGRLIGFDYPKKEM